MCKLAESSDYFTPHVNLVKQLVYKHAPTVRVLHEDLLRLVLFAMQSVHSSNLLPHDVPNFRRGGRRCVRVPSARNGPTTNFYGQTFLSPECAGSS